MIKIERWTKPEPPTQEEAEAKLSADGFESFQWYDVPGQSYPRHRHDYDEWIWVMKGEISFHLEDQEVLLKAGDRLFVPARTPHTANVSIIEGVTYLVGERRSP